MYRSVLLIVIIISFSFSFVTLGFAREPELRLETVYEKSFEDTIVDVIFDTATVILSEAKKMGWKKETFGEEEIERGKVNISYPKVIVYKVKNGKEIDFINERGKLMKKHTFRGKAIGVRISRNEKYLGVTVPKKWEKGEAQSIFKMLDSKGNILWELEGLGSGPYIPSPDGRLVVGQGSIDYPRASVCIYNKNGLIKSVKKNLSGFWVSFSQDGKYIAVGIPRVPHQKGKVILLNRKFENIWVDTNAIVTGDVGGGDYIAISPNNKYFLYPAKGDTQNRSDNLLKIVNIIEKKLLMVLPKFSVNPRYCFSSDGEQVLILRTGSWGINETLFFVNLQKRELSRETKKWKTLHNPYLTASKDLRRITIIDNKKIYFLNGRGELLQEYKSNFYIPDFSPILFLSNNGRRVTFVENNMQFKVLSLMEVVR